MGDSVLDDLRLSDEQRRAAYQDGYDTAVLAGAGCGKTATLVGRYLYLLHRGLSPDEIVAITFTERAGQEMRVRIRSHLRDYLAHAAECEDRDQWLERYIALDGAPIGTIHSFCARLLRTHPAEAALDPDFAVLDENQAAALRAEAVGRALVWATLEPEAAACFPLLGGPDGLRGLLTVLLARRLEVEEALAASGSDVLGRWVRARRQWLFGVLHGKDWDACLAALEELTPLRPGDVLDGHRCAALEAVRAARRSASERDWEGALCHLDSGLRRPGNAGSRANWGDQAVEARRALTVLCDLYRDQVERVTSHADAALDEALAAVWPGLQALFRQAVGDYEALKAQRQAVDFDDLEAGALRLLQCCPEVADYHRSRGKAILVDEFQDTNERQRRLIEALLGGPAGQVGRLFIVGDAKQSIYRFRGADVTVFRRMEDDIARSGGWVCTLEHTYRAHAGLVDVLNELLAAVLETEDDPARPYRVPFAPLKAATERSPRVRPPFVELHLGVGDSAEEGRQAAGAALAERLSRLHRDEGVPWGEMACLFRATTNFGVYEEALERAAVPYVTVAGKGFFERPEVRDLLNALHAVASLTDDVALAGLLRSPAFGLADASLYLLRWGPDGRARPLWAALRGDLSVLPPAEQARAYRAAQVVEEVAGQVGRQPVAAMLKRFLDLTGYRAILRLCPRTERATRNVDKLLADAHHSGAAGVGDFMAYVQTLSATAAREGEAPPEAGEAVQLMSVHKAKGLEFGVVAIADAGHDDRARIPDVLLHPEWGLLVRVGRAEGSERHEGLAHRLARSREEEMQDAEERRLLYVAATRAREKLLVSGHAKRAKERLSLQGWIRKLAEAIGEHELAAVRAPDPGSQATLSLWQGRVSCTFYGRHEEEQARETPPAPAPLPAAAVPVEYLPAALLRPCRTATGEPGDAAGAAGGTIPSRAWRVIPKRQRQQGPRGLVGTLVHLGLRFWRFEGEPGLVRALQARARSAGLTDERQIRATVRAALRLLRRLQRSALFLELDRAVERRHEIPYIQREDAGRIDLLCRLPDGRWYLVDFKTNHLASKDGLEQAVREHAEQLYRYGRAVRALLGTDPHLLLCFLDYRGQVLVREMPAP